MEKKRRLVGRRVMVLKMKGEIHIWKRKDFPKVSFSHTPSLPSDQSSPFLQMFSFWLLVFFRLAFPFGGTGTLSSGRLCQKENYIWRRGQKAEGLKLWKKRKRMENERDFPRTKWFLHKLGNLFFIFTSSFSFSISLSLPFFLYVGISFFLVQRLERKSNNVKER